MIQALRDPGMKDRHFKELREHTGIQMALTPTLTFKNLVVLGVINFEETIKAVTDAAAKEYSIEDVLNKMIAEWKIITMDVIPYKTTGMQNHWFFVCICFKRNSCLLLTISFCIEIIIHVRNIIFLYVKYVN